MGKELFALQDGNEILYVICIYRGHIFRRYPDGKIESSDDQERKIAVKYN